ncbi:MAG: beta-galactosidase [Kiritimatiellae bacterium]|nr:beta-galactosidase [Kiritimatiellia bacterium]MDD5521747.1 beta-galactosidase [Kiritimatiellia bacterium]
MKKHIAVMLLLFNAILVLNEPLTFSASAESLPRPSWLGKEPLIIVGNWDSMPIFRFRVGGNPVWQEDDYFREHTDEAVRKLKEMGVTMAVIHFYKAFGLVAEQEQMEDSKKLAALCKKYGIKVGVYVGSTVGYETFLAEKPEAEKWFVPDYLGEPVRYGGTQTFRKRVYFMHPGYIKYMKRVLKIAIQDLKVDLIHFDNTSMQAQPQVFFHPLAIENFRKYLKDKYTPEMLKRRFGHNEVRFIEPPKYARSPSAINDPLFQEWADFRCQQLADYYGEMEKYIRGLNPEVAVENNPHSGISGDNTIWSQGVDYPRLLSHTDIVWTEEGNKATVGKDGILISKIRTYKMASTLNNKIFTYTSESPLQMAEAMAYNRQCMGMVGGALAGYELPQEQRNYIKFYHKNFNHYKDIINVADVAVLHSYATMGFNNDRPYQSTFLFEQALIQAKIPFDVIFDHNLKDLSKYKVLVLADQECLDDEKLDLVRNFVRGGGGLIATEHTSLYTEWRQRKRDFGLKDLFNIEAPAYAGSVQPEQLVKSAVVKNQIGKGRVVYVPEVKAAMARNSADRMASRYWKLPLNWQELMESVRWAANENLSINIEAPLTVTMELMQDINKSKLLLHLLNYDVERTNLVKDIQVTTQIPAGKSVKQVILLSPDEEKDQTIPYKVNGQGVNFSVPQLKTYNLVVISLN